MTCNKKVPGTDGRDRTLTLCASLISTGVSSLVTLVNRYSMKTPLLVTNEPSGPRHPSMLSKSTPNSRRNTTVSLSRHIYNGNPASSLKYISSLSPSENWDQRRRTHLCDGTWTPTRTHIVFSFSIHKMNSLFSSTNKCYHVMYIYLGQTTAFSG